jgi:hypothetical protein
MEIYDVDNLTNFLNCSSQNNWIIYGAVSNYESKNNSNKSSIFINELNDPLSKHPVILVIGSEGKDKNYDLYIIYYINIYLQYLYKKFLRNRSSSKYFKYLSLSTAYIITKFK